MIETLDALSKDEISKRLSPRDLLSLSSASSALDVCLHDARRDKFMIRRAFLTWMAKARSSSMLARMVAVMKQQQLFAGQLFSSGSAPFMVERLMRMMPDSNNNALWIAGAFDAKVGGVDRDMITVSCREEWALLVTIYAVVIAANKTHNILTLAEKLHSLIHTFCRRHSMPREACDFSGGITLNNVPALGRRVDDAYIAKLGIAADDEERLMAVDWPCVSGRELRQMKRDLQRCSLFSAYLLLSNFSS
jgi:hypothetical protein